MVFPAYNANIDSPNQPYLGNSGIHGVFGIRFFPHWEGFAGLEIESSSGCMCLDTRVTGPSADYDRTVALALAGEMFMSRRSSKSSFRTQGGVDLDTGSGLLGVALG